MHFYRSCHPNSQSKGPFADRREALFTLCRELLFILLLILFFLNFALQLVLGQTYFQTEVLQVNVTLLNLTGLGLYYAETITEGNDSLKYSSSGALHLAVSPVRVVAPRLSISRSGLYLFLSLAFRSQRYRVLFRRAAEFVQDVSN